ncbi:MAG: DUF1802 family protein [Chthoniobacterales bacterium]|nr:DUF1802 family protein [Chthoniobacterales bacterium]
MKTETKLSGIVAFKEWALICEALGMGHQSLLLRKGGIAEGKNGFGFEHKEFFLFPTWFHGQVDKTRLTYPSAVSNEAPETLNLEYKIVVEWSGFVTNRQQLAQLEELHILHHSVIEERFQYDAGNGLEGLHVAFVRVYRMDPSLELPMQKRFGGCRSWVALPEMNVGTLISVLSDEEHTERRTLVNRVLGLS